MCRPRWGQLPAWCEATMSGCSTLLSHVLHSSLFHAAPAWWLILSYAAAIMRLACASMLAHLAALPNPDTSQLDGKQLEQYPCL
jgi:hypothetical protein